MAESLGAKAEKVAKSKFLQDLVFLGVTSVLTMWSMTFMLKRLDPSRQRTKQQIQRKKEIQARLGRAIDTDQYEDVIACDVVNPASINVTFEKIGGLANIKESLYENIILPLTRPDLFSRSSLLSPVKGCLLYGPPGTGKTMLAKAIAKESGAFFINVKISQLQSKWFGDAQKLVTAVFTLAWKLQPCIIFIDEIDAFLGTRKSQEHEAVTTMKTEFLSLWDGFSTDNTAQVTVLAATNRPYEVDEAVLRRLPKQFEVGLPDLEQRKSILGVLLRKERVEQKLKPPNGPGVHEVASLTDGYSGSDLQELCKAAAFQPLRELLRDEKSRTTIESGSFSRLLKAKEGGKASGGSAKKQKPTEASSSNGEEMPKPRALRTQDFVDVLREQRPSTEAAFAYERSVSMQRTAATGVPRVPSGSSMAAAQQQAAAMAAMAAMGGGGAASAAAGQSAEEAAFNLLITQLAKRFAPGGDLHGALGVESPLASPPSSPNRTRGAAAAGGRDPAKRRGGADSLE